MFSDVYNFLLNWFYGGVLPPFEWAETFLQIFATIVSLIPFFLAVFIIVFFISFIFNFIRGIL